ncbi:MAG TPA: helix-turn-helix transcriptional regulator [Phenylobacterium sp.]
MLSSPDLNRIAGALRAARIDRGMTQRELGEHAGLHQTQVARAEAGKDLRLSTLLELAHAAGLEIYLAPQSLGPAIRALAPNAAPAQATERPVYALDDDEHA